MKDKVSGEQVSPPQQLPPLTPSESESRRLEGWIVAASQGDESAFDRLYQLYVEKIYNYCFYRLKNQVDAEDLCAQVFLQAWQALGRYKPGTAPFLAWLYRIAHNLVVNHYKARRRYYEVADAGLDDYFLESIEAADGPGSNPLEKLLAQGQRLVLEQALEKLNEEQRQIIYLRFVEDYSHAEIGRLLGKKEGAVRAVQFRAIEKLSKLLGKERYFEN